MEPQTHSRLSSPSQTTLKVKSALDQIVAFSVKADDAPCSASSHLNAAIRELLLLLGDGYTPPYGDEGAEVIAWAQQEYEILTGKQQS